MKKRIYMSVFLVVVLLAATVVAVTVFGESDLSEAEKISVGETREGAETADALARSFSLVTEEVYKTQGSVGRLAFSIQDKAREATARYQRMDLVLADGYTRLFDCISHPTDGAMGVHYIQPERLDSSIELTQPEALVFEPQPDGRLKLVAVEYIIPAAVWPGGEPPTFLGQTLQYKTAVGPHEVFLGQTLQYKTAVGPHEVDRYYELHAWVWADNPAGMFADWNPEVTCSALDQSIEAGSVTLGREYRASYSGDDAYDQSAGSHPELYVAGAKAASYGGDDAYDPAAGGYPETSLPCDRC